MFSRLFFRPCMSLEHTEEIVKVEVEAEVVVIGKKNLNRILRSNRP